MVATDVSLVLYVVRALVDCCRWRWSLTLCAADFGREGNGRCPGDVDDDCDFLAVEGEGSSSDCEVHISSL